MQSWLLRGATMVFTLWIVGSVVLSEGTATAEQSRQSSEATGSAVGYGLRLTLALPHLIYPRNALVQASVQVDNLTNGDVWYPWDETGRGCPPLSYQYPIVRAVGANGTVYPPAMPPDLPIGGCMPLAYANYRPEEQRAYTIPVVLVANRVRVTLLVENANRTGSMPLEAELRVKLTHEVAPTVSIRAKGNNLIATVRPGEPVQGPLYYLDRVSCGGGPDSYLISYHDNWTPHHGRTLRSGYYSWCAPPDHWYLMVGWLNHPIAIVRYARS